MTDTPLTLKDMFADASGKPAFAEAGLAAVTAAVTAATAVLPPAAGAKIADGIHQALEAVLDLNLGDVLQTSWGKAAALRDAIIATLKDPTSIALVPLIDHKITSKHKPHIDLVYGSQSLAKLVFDITLNLALKGVMLEVRQGHIVGVKAGTCLGDGTFAFADKPLIVKKTPEIALPGKLKFTSSVQYEGTAVPQAAV